MNNDIVIVTGGTSGLGYELVRQLIEKDYFVCNLSKNKDRLQKMDIEFTNNYKSFCGDIADETFIRNTVKEINNIGNIIGLINNADKGIFKLPTDYIKEDIDLCSKGLSGMILLTSQVLKIKKEENLKIINIMSSAALRGNKQESVYCAMKWGQRGYTESLKVAYKGTSVKVIGVYPGGINTNFYKNSRDYVSEEKQNTFMDPKDVAIVIVNNVFNNINLTVSDLVIERNQ